MAHDFDLVIRGGQLADGRGGPLVEADVAVRDGRIAAAGKFGGSGREEIDARGLLVTPGFVDIHTHYDGQSTWDSRLAPSSWHGVTTIVMGNCGVGFAPVRKADHNRLIELMEGVEDIPGAALHEGLNWSWKSFGQYLDAVERRPHDIDICAQLPHGALRVYVMGERGARLDPATPEDIAQMRVLAADAMRAGAIGFSTSRTLNHRTVKGDPTPSLRATEAELVGIAQGLADAGSGVIELISDFDTPDLESEFAMIRRIMEASGRPLSLSLAQGHRSTGRLARNSGAASKALRAMACRSAGRWRRGPSGCCWDFRVRSIRFPRSRPSSQSRTSRWRKSSRSCAIPHSGETAVGNDPRIPNLHVACSAFGLHFPAWRRTGL